MTSSEGAFVYSVEDGSPAAQAGLQLGDVITKVGDTEVNTMEDLNAAKKQYSAGDTVTMTIDRQGETLTVEITWGSVPQEQQVTTQEQSASQPSQGYTDPYDLFDYFFGNGGYSGSSARNAA